MENGKIVSIEDRIPKLKQQRKKKANRRLTLMLLLFFIMILCIIYFQSPLSKVQKISVSGNDSIATEIIQQSSGITDETNIWKINKEEAEARLESLPEVEHAKVSLRLPNTINIELEEFEKLAYLSKESEFFPVLSNGRVLENSLTQGIPVHAPILFSFEEGDILDEVIASLKQLPEEIISTISEIHHSPSETDSYRIYLYMNNGFEVNASLRNFSEKMIHYPSIISQLDPMQKGVIDIEVGSYFKAFEAEEAEEVELEKETQD
ncbi:cell division protein FtsQ [Mesobacillus persicus]|uniref:Cell division protein DivIB n=1 Tax=Mesobacillus persicus TaxID=930146 RepID=A0A1H8FB83_9BACI|nr:cell division protein FtsQ/DivIB [Mesobacillus persicus]SEN28969.1 cell division protein FtsQ [Mesobacillus persicus]